MGSGHSPGDPQDLPFPNRPKGLEYLRNQGAQIINPIRPSRHDDDGDAEFREVLLILEILVGGHEHFEAAGRGTAQQLAVLKSRPAELGYGSDVVAG